MTTASSTKIEFVVQMTCESCVKAVKSALADDENIKGVNVDLTTGSVVVDTTLSADNILKKLKTTGRKAVIKGYGTLAGVAILDTGSHKVQGVVRFVQNPSSCVIDGTIDGLTPGKHQLMVHECGDMSQGCDSVGNFYNPHADRSSRVYGDLGCVEAEPNGRAAFRFDDNVIKLSDIIGRALVISENGKRLACGIIARSAGLFENPKMICACDGVSIWDEKKNPHYSL